MLILFIDISVSSINMEEETYQTQNFGYLSRRREKEEENHSRDKVNSRILFYLLKLHCIRQYFEELIFKSFYLNYP